MSFSFRRTTRRDDVIVDRLTGAFNRRQLDVDIAAGVDTSGKSTATLMIDVNDFVGFDGKNGHAKGDQVLERVAWVIMATVRTTDVVYRHEASTFCVLLPSTSDGDAVVVADRIRSNVAKMPLLADCGVSITVGVASGPSEDVRDAVDRAMQALDEAVRSGQARILLTDDPDYSPPDDPTGPTPRPALAEQQGSVDTLAAPKVETLAAQSDPVENEPTEVRRPLLDPNNPFDAAVMPSAHTPLVPPAVAPIDALRSSRPSPLPPTA